MTNSEKLFADIERIKKHNRSENGGKYNPEKACKDITLFFEKNNMRFGDLAASFSDFWMQKYINPSQDFQNEPTEANTEKLCSLQSYLDNEDETESLSQSDWEEIANLVNYEAENLDIQDLSNLMSVLVSKKAIK